MDDYYTEGWAALRQCAIDGQHILNCAADISIPQASGGPEEQAKAELKQLVYLAIPTTAPLKGTTGELTMICSKGPSRCIRSQARGTEDLPEAGCCPTMDRVPGADTDGRPASLGKPVAT
jgi:hypothetical protein